MQPDFEENLYSETKISEELCRNLKISSDAEDDDALKEEGNGDTDNGGCDAEEEEEFTFMCGGDGASPKAAEDLFINGQIKPIFPLFNRDLLFSGGESGALYEDLPTRPPVKKVFVEIKGEDDQPTSSASKNGGNDAGPYCEWTNRMAVEASPEICRKSNSTGFSKIWRFKDLLGRSNSDGRDAFVFLNNSQAVPAPAPAPAPAVVAKGKAKSKKNEAKVKVKKGKTTSLSAHETYLKSKAKEEGRRRSYLPYRPELMGFFTNVNSGLSKNVHPF